VFLDEGKLFERMLAARLVAHMEQVGPDLSDRQFGFRGGRSTIDAILRVKASAEESVRDGGVLIAVSLDIKNAFNTLPWRCIMEGLDYHGVPPYLRAVIGTYLRGRKISYPGRDGAPPAAEMSVRCWGLPCGTWSMMEFCGAFFPRAWTWSVM